MNKTHNLSRRALVAAGVIVLALAPMTASAGKPAGSSGSGTIGLVVLNGATEAHHGGQVTFNVTTSNTRPFVSLNCYQGGTWVYAASAGFFSGYPWSTDFTLASGSWPSGDAECTARLYSTKDGTRTTTLAPLLNFHVGA
jgi:hypothetical protein